MHHSAVDGPWIALVRHGRPHFDHDAWLAPRELAQWIADFNRCSIVNDPAPPRVLALANQAGIVISSTLERSIQSAGSLATSPEPAADPMFIEAGLPHNDWPAPRLPVGLWLLLFRCAWFVGFSANAESRTLATCRAKLAAGRLTTLAQQHGSLLLVGHGVFNRMLGSQLRARGWDRTSRPSSRWWGVTIYRSSMGHAASAN